MVIGSLTIKVVSSPRSCPSRQAGHGSTSWSWWDIRGAATLISAWKLDDAVRPPTATKNNHNAIHNSPFRPSRTSMKTSITAAALALLVALGIAAAKSPELVPLTFAEHLESKNLWGDESLPVDVLPLTAHFPNLSSLSFVGSSSFTRHGKINSYDLIYCNRIRTCIPKTPWSIIGVVTVNN